MILSNSRISLALLLLLACPASAFSRPDSRHFSVHGLVTDSESGETLIAAGVSCGSEGTVTNEFGFYSFSLPEGECELVFSYIGYESVTKRVLLSGDMTLNISLTPGVQLEASTVVGRAQTGVHATRSGSVELSKAQIKSTPVLFGEADVLKTIQLLPGVQSGADGFAGIFVRGGGDDENLFLLDGVPLYNPAHAFGLFSVFTPDAVKKTTFYKSDFPARFAGRASSIIDVRTVDGDMNVLHGSVSAGLLSDKFHIDGPIVKGKTSFSLTGRAVHTFFLAPLLKTKESERNYYFYDINAKLSHKFSDKDRVYFGIYSGKDYYKQYSSSDWTEGKTHFTSARNSNLLWGNSMASFRWNHVFGSRLFSNTTVFVNKYDGKTISGSSSASESEDEYSSTTSDYLYTTGVTDSGIKMDFDWAPIPRHSVRFGVSAIRHLFRPESILTELQAKDKSSPAVDTTKSENLVSDFAGGEFGVYAEDDFTIGTRMRVAAGLHMAVFTTQGKTYYRPQPRISLRYDFDGGYSLKAGYSRMSQYIHRLSSSVLTMPSDNWVPITSKIRPLTSDQFNIGALWTGQPAWECSLEGFYKVSDAVLDVRDGASAGTGASDWDRNVSLGEGLSYGAELLVRKTEGKTTGWLAYTLSRTTRVFPDGSINNGKPYPFRYDRRHAITLCVDNKLSDKVSLTASWHFASGQMVTVPTRVVSSYDVNGTDQMGFYIPARNNYRLEPDHRLDLSISIVNRKKRGTGTWNIGVYNVYAHKNTLSVDYDLKGDLNGVQYGDEAYGYYARLEISRLSALLFIPSFSYTYSF